MMKVIFGKELEFYGLYNFPDTVLGLSFRRGDCHSLNEFLDWLKTNEIYYSPYSVDRTFFKSIIIHDNKKFLFTKLRWCNAD